MSWVMSRRMTCLADACGRGDSRGEGEQTKHCASEIIIHGQQEIKNKEHPSTKRLAYDVPACKHICFDAQVALVVWTPTLSRLPQTGQHDAVHEHATVGARGRGIWVRYSRPYVRSSKADTRDQSKIEQVPGDKRT